MNTQHVITVAASDRELSAQAQVFIDVLQIPNRPPSLTNHHFSVPDTLTDSEIIDRVVAVDPEGDELLFTLLSNDDDLFIINSNNGDLSLSNSQSFDLDVTNRHLVVVSVSDREFLTNAAVTIDVKAMPSLSNHIFTVLENINDNEVIGTVLATDRDSPVLNYRIVTTQSLFEVDSTSGELSLVNGQFLDYETQRQHSFTLQVSDDVFSNSNTVTIDVNNVIENVINITNVSDTSDLLLNGAEGMTTAQIGGATYLFVTGWNLGDLSFQQDGFNVFSVDSDGRLVNITNVNQTGLAQISGANDATTAQIGNNTYLFVKDYFNYSFNVFSVGNGGQIANVTNASNFGVPGGLIVYGLYFGITTALVGNTSYCFVTGNGDEVFGVFAVNSNGHISNVTNVVDNDRLKTDGNRGITTTKIDNNTYLFVSGEQDDGFSVFSVDNNGVINDITNVSDAAGLNLGRAGSLITTEVEGKTYLFVSGEQDASFGPDGFSVFSVNEAGGLSNVTNVNDNNSLNLRGIRKMTAAVLGGSTYLFTTAGNPDNGFSIFSVDGGGMIENITNIADTPDLNLNYASGVTTAEIGGRFYLFVNGRLDNGFSVFQLE